MYCINCGKELPDDAKFCPGCGNKIGSKPKADVKMPDFKMPDVKIPDFSNYIKAVKIPKKILVPAAAGIAAIILIILSIVLFSSIFSSKAKLPHGVKFGDSIEKVLDKADNSWIDESILGEEFVASNIDSSFLGFEEKTFTFNIEYYFDNTGSLNRVEMDVSYDLNYSGHLRNEISDYLNDSGAETVKAESIVEMLKTKDMIIELTNLGNADCSIEYRPICTENFGKFIKGNKINLPYGLEFGTSAEEIIEADKNAVFENSNEHSLDSELCATYFGFDHTDFSVSLSYHLDNSGNLEAVSLSTNLGWYSGNAYNMLRNMFVEELGEPYSQNDNELVWEIDGITILLDDWGENGTISLAPASEIQNIDQNESENENYIPASVFELPFGVTWENSANEISAKFWENSLRLDYSFYGIDMPDDNLSVSCLYLNEGCAIQVYTNYLDYETGLSVWTSLENYFTNAAGALGEDSSDEASSPSLYWIIGDTRVEMWVLADDEPYSYINIDYRKNK